MKYIFSFLIAGIFLASCSDNTPKMNLSGEVKGLKKGTVLLQKINDTLLESVDSVQIDGSSTFQLSTAIESPEMYYLYVRLKNGTLADEKVAFFAEPGEITIQTTLDNIAFDAVVTGSTNNDKLLEYDKIIARYKDKNLDYIEQTLNAQLEGKDSLADELENKQRSLLSSKYLATINYAMNNNDYEIAPYLALSEIYDANVTYLDTLYNKLTPRIKESTYGMALQEFISIRKQDEK